MKVCERKYRFLSMLCDLFISLSAILVICLIFVPNKFIGSIFNESEITITTIDLIKVLEVGLYCEIFLIIYSCLIPYIHGGQTVGMRLFKIKYVRFDDSKIRFSDLFVREILMKIFCVIISFGLYIFADIAVFLCRGDRLSLSDIVSKVKIVDKLDY